MKSTCLLLLAVGWLATTSLAQAPITKIFIVRHADRNGSLDELTPAGVTRANELKRVLANASIDSIFSTDIIRTKKTAQPLANLQGLPITIYSDIPTLVNRILSHSAGKRILVVGHSDTIDDIIKKCNCIPPTSITPQIPSTVYDNLFEVLVQKIPKPKAIKCELIQLKYGAVTN